MKSRTSMLATAVAVSGLTFALNAFATPAGHLPATHTQGEITYLSGGIGQTEADAIKHAARHYPLELEFLHKAKPNDQYLADVKVQIKDAHDKMVLDVKADGPFLLAKMPAGKYALSAERNGKVEHRDIEVGPKEHRRVVFEWKS